MLNGMLTGIIAQCAGCDRYIPAFSAIIGVMGGLVYLLGHKSMVLLKLDDPLDAVAVHAGGGKKLLKDCEIIISLRLPLLFSFR